MYMTPIGDDVLSPDGHYFDDVLCPQMDTMLMLRNYLDRLTPSEFHCFLVGGHATVAGFVFGFFGSTVALWHATFTINSLSHVIGTRRYATSDTSRNNPALALLTMGESWHNNHHHYQAAARNGFYWWEIDLTWYGLKTMEKLGLVSKLRVPSTKVLERNRIKDGAFDEGMFRARHRALTAVVDGRNGGDHTPGQVERARLQLALTEVDEAAEELAAAQRPTAAARAQARTLDAAKVTSRQT